MGNECRDFFRTICKVAGVTQREIIKLVWGKAFLQDYWVGDKSSTVQAHCIWCARAEVAGWSEEDRKRERNE